MATEGTTNASAAVEINELLPNAKELRALRIFVSTDETRQHLATLWAYASDGGCTYVATDGHTEIVRRAGLHRTMPLHDIVKLTPFAVDKGGSMFETVTKPPRWDYVLKSPVVGKLALAYGMSPEYFGRVGDVERAARAREADDFKPTPGMSIKDQKKKKADLKLVACATWAIPSDPLDGWFFKLNTTAALWEGIIMPRRV